MGAHSAHPGRLRPFAYQHLRRLRYRATRPRLPVLALRKNYGAATVAQEYFSGTANQTTKIQGRGYHPPPLSKNCAGFFVIGPQLVGHLKGERPFTFHIKQVRGANFGALAYVRRRPRPSPEVR